MLVSSICVCVFVGGTCVYVLVGSTCMCACGWYMRGCACGWCMCGYACEWYMQMRVDAHTGQQRALSSLGLELQAMSCLPGCCEPDF